MALPTWATGVSSCLNTSQLFLIQLVHFDTAALSKAERTRTTCTGKHRRGCAHMSNQPQAQTHKHEHTRRQMKGMLTTYRPSSHLNGCFTLTTDDWSCSVRELREAQLIWIFSDSVIFNSSWFYLKFCVFFVSNKSRFLVFSQQLFVLLSEMTTVACRFSHLLLRLFC